MCSPLREGPPVCVLDLLLDERAEVEGLVVLIGLCAWVAEKALLVELLGVLEGTGASEAALSTNSEGSEDRSGSLQESSSATCAEDESPTSVTQPS